MRSPAMKSSRRAIFLLLWWLLSCATGLAFQEESERLYFQGLLPFSEGRYEDALELFRQAAAQQPPYYQAVYFLGVTYGKLGRYQEALQAFEKTLQLVPEFGPALQDLGVVHYRLKHYDQALRLLEQAESKEPDNGYTLYYKGLCHYQLARQGPPGSSHGRQAAESLIEAARRAPRLEPLANYYLGLNYLAEGQLASAEESFQKTALDNSAAGDLAAAAVRNRNKARRLRLQWAGLQLPKRWELRFRAGGEFDSNVILEPERGPAIGQISDKEDFRSLLSAGGSFRLWRRAGFSLTASYDLHQALYTDLTDFNLQAHQGALNAFWQPGRQLQLGLEGRIDHYRLGGKDYVQEISIMPSAGFFLGSRFYTSASYRWRNVDYRTPVFDPIRDGNEQEAAVRQYWFLEGFERCFYLGYRFARENPSSAAGNDFEYDANEVQAGLRLTLLERTSAELGYSFRNDDYRFPNSLSLDSIQRSDNAHYFQLVVSRYMRRGLKLSFRYENTIHNSNLSIFRYDRRIAAVGLEFVL